MDYTFYILTTNGKVSGNVTTDTDFDCAPFGHVPYRIVSSCDCDPPVIDDFWKSIDLVLAQNNLTSSEFVRAMYATTPDGKHYGELPQDTL
jgi:hypothetical protein